MKTDPFSAFDQYADVVEAQMVRMTEELRTLREEVRTLRSELEQRSATAIAVVGPPGPPGPADPQGERGTDGIAGQPGERGVDGAATLEDIDARIEARFAELQVRSLADWYRDVYRADVAYQRSNLVTYDGQLWLALADSKAQQPGTSAAWKLITKKGRDGRDKT